MESPGQNLGLRLWRNGLKPWRNMVFRIADMTVKVAAVVVAAGRGLREGSLRAGEPKAKRTGPETRADARLGSLFQRPPVF